MNDSDRFELAQARIECCLDLLRKYPCRQWLRRVLVILCAEFLDLLPALSEEQQAAVAERVAFFVIDAIIEQPGEELFRLTLRNLLLELIRSAGIETEVIRKCVSAYGRICGKI